MYDNTKLLTVKISTDLHHAIKSLADEQEKTIAATVRHILRQHLSVDDREHNRIIGELNARLEACETNHANKLATPDAVDDEGLFAALGDLDKLAS